ncbi:phosphoribosylamine--glycine ligase [Gemmatimonas aurantiaca]|nr:phosphoribosylamine--glycine ligase [Gemmatimonas aurantiaca]
MSEERTDKPRRSRRRRPRRSNQTGQQGNKPDTRGNQGNQTGSRGSGEQGNSGNSGKRQAGQQGRGKGQRGRTRRDTRRRSGPGSSSRSGASDGKLRLLVIGSGGREHALVWKLSQSPKVGKIFAIPGNPGISKLAKCVEMKPERTRDIAAFAARNNIDLTVVGPEAPLAAGIVDEFNKRNLKIFGPTKAAMRLESSKAYAKEFMRRYSIPTASFRVFDNPNEAITLCRTAKYPLVIKADGLAAGKGVVIVDNFSEAVTTIKEIMVDKIFGSAGKQILIEDFIKGYEASIMGFCDGEQCWPMIPSQDHKRLGDGDTGPNTGGMGAYAPATFVTDAMMDEIQERILNAFIVGMAKDGNPFKGVIYAGIMVTENGPKVIEFNCRFGDPEAQVLLPLLESDLAEIMLRIARKPITKPSSKKHAAKNSRRKPNADKKDSSEADKSEQEIPEKSGPVYLRDLIDKYPPPDDEEEETSQEISQEVSQQEVSQEVSQKMSDEDKPTERAKQTESRHTIRWSSGSAACISLASAGYPVKPEKGKKITGLGDYSKQHCQLFHAGIRKINDSWVTAGGRVLSVTAIGDNLQQSLERAYAVVDQISFPGMQFRKDIGHQAFDSELAPLSKAD